jgi:hypothetical protein
MHLDIDVTKLLFLSCDKVKFSQTSHTGFNIQRPRVPMSDVGWIQVNNIHPVVGIDGEHLTNLGTHLVIVSIFTKRSVDCTSTVFNIQRPRVPMGDVGGPWHTLP